MVCDTLWHSASKSHLQGGSEICDVGAKKAYKYVRVFIDSISPPSEAINSLCMSRGKRFKVALVNTTIFSQVAYS